MILIILLFQAKQNKRESMYMSMYRKFLDLILIHSVLPADPFHLLVVVVSSLEWCYCLFMYISM